MLKEHQGPVDNTKRFNICVIGVQRRGESVVQKKIYEEIIPENLPKFGKDINLQFMNLSEPQTE